MTILTKLQKKNSLNFINTNIDEITYHCKKDEALKRIQLLIVINGDDKNERESSWGEFKDIDRMGSSTTLNVSNLNSNNEIIFKEIGKIESLNGDQRKEVKELLIKRLKEKVVELESPPRRTSLLSIKSLNPISSECSVQ